MEMDIRLGKKKRVKIAPLSFFIAHLLLGEVFLTALLAAVTGFPAIFAMFAFLGTGIREGAGGILIVLSTFSIINYF